MYAHMHMRTSPVLAIRNSGGKVAGLAWMDGSSCEHHVELALHELLGLNAEGVQTIPVPERQVLLEDVPVRSTFYGKTTLTVLPEWIGATPRIHRSLVKSEMELFTHHTYARHSIGAWTADSFGITSSVPEVQDFIIHLSATLKSPGGGVRFDRFQEWLGNGFFLGIPALEDEVSRQVLPGLVQGQIPQWFNIEIGPQRMAD